MTEEEGLELWRKALEEPNGIAVKCDNRHNMSQRLYIIRARHKEQDFSDLMIVNGENPKEIWIIPRPITKPIKPMEEDDLDGL